MSLCFAAGIFEICRRFSVDSRGRSRWCRGSFCAGEDSGCCSLLAYSIPCMVMLLLHRWASWRDKTALLGWEPGQPFGRQILLSTSALWAVVISSHSFAARTTHQGSSQALPNALSTRTMWDSSVRAQLDFKSLPKATFGQVQSAKKGWQLPWFLLQTLQMGCGLRQELWPPREHLRPWPGVRDGFNPLSPPGHLQHLHSKW